MSNPMISVVMPVYNGEKYLNEAIDSILNQTYTDFEFIILNDGSSDKTEDIILSYDDPRIIYVKNEINLQIVKTLNKGIGLAKGKYIARMDADDISLPERFEKQISFLKKNPDVDVCGTWYETFGVNKYLQKLPLDHEQIKTDMLFYTPIAHPTVMMKKSIFDHFKYPEAFPKAEDYALWIQLIDNYRFWNLPLPLLRYRVHEKQTGILYSNIQQKSTKQALSLYLKNIGILSVEKVHNQIMCKIPVQISKVEIWLNYIKNKNLSNHYFDNIFLDNTLFHQWWIMNNIQTRYNFLSLVNLYTSPLYVSGNLTLAMHLKFWLKCIIHYKKVKKH